MAADPFEQVRCKGSSTHIRPFVPGETSARCLPSPPGSIGVTRRPFGSVYVRKRTQATPVVNDETLVFPDLCKTCSQAPPVITLSNEKFTEEDKSSTQDTERLPLGCLTMEKKGKLYMDLKCGLGQDAEQKISDMDTIGSTSQLQISRSCSKPIEIDQVRKNLLSLQINNSKSIPK